MDKLYVHYSEMKRIVEGNGVESNGKESETNRKESETNHSFTIALIMCEGSSKLVFQMFE